MNVFILRHLQWVCASHSCWGGDLGVFVAATPLPASAALCLWEALSTRCLSKGINRTSECHFGVVGLMRLDNDAGDEDQAPVGIGGSVSA